MLKLFETGGIKKQEIVVVSRKNALKQPIFSK